MESLVSVIIPAYNVEKYIEDSLDSVCNQTYKNLQIIVVDDGSKDGTYEKIKEVASVDKRILALRKENGGVSSARNYALSYAEGEYITFLDADDYLEEDAISILVNSMEKTNADWVSCQFSNWDEKGRRPDEYNFIRGVFSLTSEEERYNFLVKELIPYHVGVEACGKLFRAEIILENGLRFPEGCSLGEDISFTVKYLTCSKSITCISDRLYRYIKRPGSAMDSSYQLNKALYERQRMLGDISAHIIKTDNKYFMQKFPLIFALFMDKIYIGHCAEEISGILLGLEDADDFRNMYRNLTGYREEFISLCIPETARMKYRYHMFLRGRLIGSSFSEKLGLFLYNLYRNIRGKESLESWIMPY
ncbi:MAG: glycosyltransferase [Lachnospiraceae bacterium]|nr:glycosyltransferase [Lachnospiraceae bacterium]